MCVCLSAPMAFRPSASACFCFSTTTKNGPPSTQTKRAQTKMTLSKGTMHGWSTTQSARRQRVYWAPGCTQGTQTGQRTWHFLHVRGKREAGRLREYRLKRVDTHWLFVVPFRVSMTHRYRPLKQTGVCEIGDIVERGRKGD